jgi:RimJ/RimL family protein N-acetyltransferase
MGTAFLSRSIEMYFERFALKVLASEPYAENAAPKRALSRLGFRLVRRYRTIPTGMAFEQEVNRYEVTREGFHAAGAKHDA